MGEIAEKAVAVAKAPVHAFRGSSDDETMLKNAKTEYFNEAEEIATYRAIEEKARAYSHSACEWFHARDLYSRSSPGDPCAVTSP